MTWQAVSQVDECKIQC